MSNKRSLEIVLKNCSFFEKILVNSHKILRGLIFCLKNKIIATAKE